MNHRDRKEIVAAVLDEGIFNTREGVEAMVERITDAWERDVENVHHETWTNTAQACELI
jgi:hypothetical protein